jgi:hypothetical protein
MSRPQTPEEEHQEHIDLIHQLHDAGWGLAESQYMSDGVRHRYRDQPWTFGLGRHADALVVRQDRRRVDPQFLG